MVINRIDEALRALASANTLIDNLHLSALSPRTSEEEFALAEVLFNVQAYIEQAMENLKPDNA